MPRSSVLLALLLALLALTSGLSAQDASRDGKPVNHVIVDGSVGVLPELVRSNLRTQAGRPYSSEDVEADMRWLHDRYGIIVETVDFEGGVVTFVLKRIRAYSEVLFEGNDRFTDATLRRTAGLVTEGGVAPDKIEKARRLITEHYQKKGYPFIQVEPDPYPLAEGGRGMKLLIYEGPWVDIDALHVEGLTALDVDDALGLLRSKPGFWSWLVGTSYERAKLERDILILEEFVQREGYRDARVSLEELDWDEERENVEITLRVDEGALYRVRSLTVEGNTEFTDAELLEDSPLQVGAAFRAADFERVVRRIQAKYGEAGFLDADIRDGSILSLEDSAYDVILKLDERQRKKVRDVIVRGNVGTRDGVVRRYLTVYPGDVVDTREIAYSEDALIALNYFTDLAGSPRVRVTTEPTPDPEYVDVVVEIDDSTSGLFSFVLGAGSDSGLFGGISVDKRNFDITRSASSFGGFFTEFFGQGEAYHGGGQRLFMEIVPGTETTNIDVVFQEPWINEADETPWGYSIEAYDRTRLFREYTQETLGFGVFWDHRFSRHHSISIGPRIESIDISDIDDPQADVITGEKTEFAKAEGRQVKHSFEFAHRYNNIDSLYEPTDGYQSRTRIQSIGGPLGGDIDAVRLQWTNEWFHPMGEDDDGHMRVLNPRFALGAVEPTNGDDLPFYENFFAGGATGPFAVRGYDFQGIGPHQEIKQTQLGPRLVNNDGEAIGGRLAAVASIEAIFPLVTQRNLFRDRDESVIKGVIFVDAGNLVADTNFSDLLQDVRYSAGVGVRLRLPALGGITVRLDWAQAFNEQEGDETRAFSFELSRRF
ncbi:MAG: outer membrane protein assembly factor BamA [Planctomycetota bacterium]|nr:MAG: outer membrane protein assembly factor BamA [Planctomycetota bacterium]